MFQPGIHTYLFSSMALLYAAAGAGFAATLCVSPDGSDAAAGSLDCPWRTLDFALQRLRSGDTLYVRGGVYRERVVPTISPASADRRVLVRAYPGERPVVKGLLRLTGASYWTFDGLNVTWDDALGTRIDHMVKITNGVGWVFENAEVWGAKSYAGILVASTVAGEPANWRLSNNVVHDTISTNAVNEDHLLYINTDLSPGAGVVERNLLYNALNGNGIKIAGPNDTRGSANIVVRFNTIYNTVHSILVSGDSHDNLIYRNILIKSDPKNGLIRGYQLKGERNTARENLGFEALSFIANDAGFTSVEDGGGNLFPVDPALDAVSPDGLRPLNPTALMYGAYAPISNEAPMK